MRIHPLRRHLISNDQVKHDPYTDFVVPPQRFGMTGRTSLAPGKVLGGLGLVKHDHPNTEGSSSDPRPSSLSSSEGLPSSSSSDEFSG